MKTSETVSEIFTALVEFNKIMPAIPKDSNNPFFKSKYAKLEAIQQAIKEPMINCGLGVVQFPVDKGGLCTRVFHVSGEWLEETYFMDADKATPQGWGSVITYQRRYALGAVLNLDIDDDDDGNNASKKETGTTTAKPAANSKSQEDGKSWLHENTENWEKAKAWLLKEPTREVKQLFEWYKISKENQTKLQGIKDAFK